MKNVRIVLWITTCFLLFSTLVLALSFRHQPRAAQASPASLSNQLYLPLAMNFNFEIVNNGLFVFSDRDEAAGLQSFIYTMRGDGTELTKVTAGLFPDLSPDGSQISYDINQEIYVVNIDGSNPVNLTNHPAWEDYSDWSPDGTRIAFGTSRDGNAEVYAMNADGTNPLNLTNNSAWDGEPDWSPDGSQVVFISDRTGARNVHVMAADGSNQSQLTHFASWTTWPSQPAWSPDGTKIAFSADSDTDSDRDIFIMDSDGSNLAAVTDLPTSDFGPVWSPDGSMIAFSANSDAKPMPTFFATTIDGAALLPLGEGTVSNWIAQP